MTQLALFGFVMGLLACGIVGWVAADLVLDYRAPPGDAAQAACGAEETQEIGRCADGVHVAMDGGGGRGGADHRGPGSAQSVMVSSVGRGCPGRAGSCRGLTRRHHRVTTRCTGPTAGR